ncbi:MAG: transposase [Thermoleophilaceae bacterium]
MRVDAVDDLAEPHHAVRADRSRRLGAPADPIPTRRRATSGEHVVSVSAGTARHADERPRWPARAVRRRRARVALFADAGHRGKEHHQSLQLAGVELIVPDKHKLGERPAAEVEKARIRLVIESVFSTLKRQMRLEDHLAKTLPGLAQRVVQRLLALSLGMLIHALLARPPQFPS